MIKTNMKIALGIMLLATLGYAEAEFGTVNGEEISKDEISQTLGQSGMQFATLDDAMKKRVIEMVVDRKLISQHAGKDKIEESADFKSKLELLKKELVLNLWMEKESNKVEASVTDDDLKKSYEKNKENYKVAAQLNARHILVKEEKEAKEIIETLLKAKDVKDEFIKLAKEKSTGPSGKNGGDLGWFTKDRMVPEFSAAADKLKDGEFTKEAVKTQFGYHIIYLDGRKKEGVKTFDEVKEQLKASVGKTKFNEFMDEIVKTLKKDAKIKLKEFKEKVEVKK
ncbi:MAG: peptidyl-prolyl cis-trans isomerase [Sulfurovaceae bacterium]|nr:peptidyl-prolyl cis-trans isomerase [Sulfurovaceae bacterium]